jgi:glycosyltransferase involved in cell wall biosynthesis/SAM-dependent methyltransferase
MPPIVLVAPGPLEARTGGYIYDRRMVEGLRRLGWQVDVLELDSSFPYPTPAALEHAAHALQTIRAGTITIVDSLALGAMPEIITREASRLPVVALVHLPLAAAIGLDRGSAARFQDGERRALQAAALVVVTGRAALPLIAPHAIDPGRIVVVEPGTDRAPLARGSRSTTLELLTVATLNPGKGHENLLEALAAVNDPAWRLTCAGSLTRDPATAARVRGAAARLGLEDRVAFVGDLDRPALGACYDRADLAVFATQQETYGMAVAEALAHGLPVVATMTGAIPDLVGDDAGLLVPVGDTRALSAALSRSLGDPALRERLAEGARRRRARLPTWDDAARLMSTALNGVGEPDPINALAQWLRVREPADVAARSDALTRALAEAIAPGEPLRLLDLGTGTGSNIRYLAQRLRATQRWLAVDRSAALLAELPGRMASWAAASGYAASADERRCVVRGTDFACEIETLESDVGTLDDHRIFAGRHIVTASALLDLVSESWLRALAAHCRGEGAAALFAITYNGRFTCTPADPWDEQVRDLMNRHQRRDKGLGGPAAGPDAGSVAEQCFLQEGYRVRREPSDWVLGSTDRDVQRLLIDGWADAAREMAPDRAAAIMRWRDRRLEHVEAGRSHLVVGHDDLAAWPDHVHAAG